MYHKQKPQKFTFYNIQAINISYFTHYIQKAHIYCKLKP